jgi:hypothetical protein
MRKNMNTMFSAAFRRVTTAMKAGAITAGVMTARAMTAAAVGIATVAIVAVPGAQAKPKPDAATGKQSTRIILVRPADLPEEAREGGEAIMLHETGDGRTMLYIEQKDGTRLAVLDVTDPSHVKEEACVQLGAQGAFDFVAPLGRAELVRFRGSEKMALLQLGKAHVATLKNVQGLELQAFKQPVGDDGVILASDFIQQTTLPVQDFQVVETANPRERNRVFDVKGVHAEITNENTGTTFLLTADGLYLIRRPAVEWDNEMHEFQLSHAG